ncbi:hypothetical protein [Haloarcula sp. Atlit-47R]|nr:hypothetical protein [Haloarcula sp. Atlit-47R]
MITADAAATLVLAEQLLGQNRDERPQSTFFGVGSRPPAATAP